jgi:hypothetical protein
MNTTPEQVDAEALTARVEAYLDALRASEARYGQRSAEANVERFGGSLEQNLAIQESIRGSYRLDDDRPQAKYLRLVRHGSVHAFIDKATGAVYKPASWKSPARGKDGKPVPRYFLLNDESFEALCERCEFTGGYLYADRAFEGTSSTPSTDTRRQQS